MGIDTENRSPDNNNLITAIAIAGSLLIIAGFVSVGFAIDQYGPIAWISADDALRACVEYTSRQADISFALDKAFYEGWSPHAGFGTSPYGLFRPDPPVQVEPNLIGCNVEAARNWVNTFGDQLKYALEQFALLFS